MCDSIPLESAITADIQRYLARVPDWWGFKVQGGGTQMRGVPDIVGCYRGLFVAFEVKRPKVGKLSALQAHRIDQILSAKGHASVVCGVDDVKRVIEGLAAHVCEGGTGNCGHEERDAGRHHRPDA